MDIWFVIAQILATTGWFFLILSYYKEDIHKLLRMQIFACAFETASYVFLGAFAGIFACLLDLVKAILYYKTDKSNVVFVATLPFYAVLAYFSVVSEGPIALLPAIGGIIDGFVLTRNKTVATVGSIIASTLWIIYDFIVLAYAAALYDSILVISNFFVLFLGYSRILHINKLHVIKCHYLTRSIAHNILSLDKSNYAPQYLWTLDEQRAMFKLEPDSIILIRDKKRTVGYLNYITITEEAYEKIRRAHTFYKTIPEEFIAPLRRRRKNYMLIESVCINKSYESQKMADFISHRFNLYIRNKRKQGYNFHGVISVAISDFEKDFLETAHFAHIKDYRDKEALYELDDIAIAKYNKDNA